MITNEQRTTNKANLQSFCHRTPSHFTMTDGWTTVAKSTTARDIPEGTDKILFIPKMLYGTLDSYIRDVFQDLEWGDVLRVKVNHLNERSSYVNRKTGQHVPRREAHTQATVYMHMYTEAEDMYDRFGEEGFSCFVRYGSATNDRWLCFASKRQPTVETDDSNLSTTQIPGRQPSGVSTNRYAGLETQDSCVVTVPNARTSDFLTTKTPSDLHDKKFWDRTPSSGYENPCGVCTDTQFCSKDCSDSEQFILNKTIRSPTISGAKSWAKIAGDSCIRQDGGFTLPPGFSGSAVSMRDLVEAQRM